MRKSGILIIAVYSHIEAYPPSLNAAHHLASIFERIIILVPNVMQSKWSYPENVELKPFGKYTEVSAVGKKSIFEKIAYFVRYGIYLSNLIKVNKPKLVLLYDPLSFSALNLFSGKEILKGRIPIWYHNHDVMDAKELPKFSLMWIGRQLELRYFSRITFFSLPNKVRLQYFPTQLLQHPTVILPNYPSLQIYGKQYIAKESPEDVLKLIFQGQISRSNSLESFVRILNNKIRGKNIELHLAGDVDPNYMDSLQSLANELHVTHRLIFHGLLPYGDLPHLTAGCHIGIAVYGSHNTMVKTMSTASNKIFEYASLGLPVIINKRSDMEQEFAQYRWICFSEIAEKDLMNCLTDMTDAYDQLSAFARKDIEASLNFDVYFGPFMKKIADYLEI
jgi:hypothetical protein